MIDARAAAAASDATATATATGRARLLDRAALRAWPLPLLDGDGDKESRGRVLIVAGSREMPGAALLAARAALRVGAGKVAVATAAATAPGLALAVPELRVCGVPETAAGGLDPAGIDLIAALARQCGALLIGPGMQDEQAACRLARALMERLPDVPVILDATAMAAALHEPAARRPVLLTPHAGEMAHLCGDAKHEVLTDALERATDAARRWNATLVLKGATTVIAGAGEDAPPWRHSGGNVGLATAGSGDVLVGLIAGFVARGATLAQGAAWGVVLHALAGERLAARLGGVGYFASELLDELPPLLAALDADACAPG
jgi:ADP-dependent NAD(P)H-hydrate dehydratase